MLSILILALISEKRIREEVAGSFANVVIILVI